MKKFKVLLVCSVCPLLFLLSACSESFTDARDGQSYDVVQIGSQTWMAENLNYAAVAESGANASGNGAYCPDGDERNCKRMGRLYTWAAAQTACPEGWRLPTREDFVALAKAAGDTAGSAGSSELNGAGVSAGSSELNGADASVFANAGAALKSSSGWFKKGNGTDGVGFRALPAGYMAAPEAAAEQLDGTAAEQLDGTAAAPSGESAGESAGKFDGIGGYAYFWSATTDGQESAFAHYLFLDFSSSAAEIRSFDKLSARSVRCVRR